MPRRQVSYSFFSRVRSLSIVCSCFLLRSWRSYQRNRCQPWGLSSLSLSIAGVPGNVMLLELSLCLFFSKVFLCHTTLGEGSAAFHIGLEWGARRGRRNGLKRKECINLPSFPPPSFPPFFPLSFLFLRESIPDWLWIQQPRLSPKPPQCWGNRWAAILLTLPKLVFWHKCFVKSTVWHPWLPVTDSKP